jgi:RNA polymerase sigma factor (sigma-70 family)
MRLSAYLTLKIEIDDAVQKLPHDERLIITEYYLNGLTWNEVSDKLFISLSWCYKLHNRALKRLMCSEI